MMATFSPGKHHLRIRPRPATPLKYSFFQSYKLSFFQFSKPPEPERQSLIRCQTCFTIKNQCAVRPTRGLRLSLITAFLLLFGTVKYSVRSNVNIVVKRHRSFPLCNNKVAHRSSASASELASTRLLTAIACRMVATLLIGLASYLSPAPARCNSSCL